MTVTARLTRLAPVVLALAGFGCTRATGPAPSEAVPQSPAAAPAPAAVETGTEPARPSPTEVLAAHDPASTAVETTPSPAVTPKSLTDQAPAAEPAAAAGVTLDRVRFDEFLNRIAANKKAKYTMVDAWATWCAPCKENFPHVVQMHQKYAGKGLAVVSLSLDDPAEAKQVADAQKFLRDQQAVFTNFLLDEEAGAGFEKLNVNAIPAVFVFGPDGKEVQRFTMDDPNHQFTYDEVEKAVAALLDGQPAPAVLGAPKAGAAKPPSK